MRRFNREISSLSDIEDFIAGERIMRIAFYDCGEIYIVPVNFGYFIESGKFTFIFHGASAGRKFELAKNNPKVGFEMDGKYKLITAEKPCNFSAHYQSVTGTGQLSLVYDKREKERFLNILMKQATDCKNPKFDDRSLDAVAVFRLDADKICCKAN